MSRAQDATTLPGKLAAEISRVTELRAQYRDAGKLGEEFARSVAPAIALMTASLDAAIRAAGSPDIVGQIRAVRDLEGWTE